MPHEQPTPENELRPIHSSVRESYCAICDKDCQNEHNRAEHVAGRKHLVQMYSCFIECEELKKSFQLTNGNTFERVRANKLRARDIVIITADAEIRQVIQCLVTGVVHGRRGQVEVYMSTFSRSEVTLPGTSLVYRLRDKSGDKKSYFKPPTPRNRFASGSSPTKRDRRSASQPSPGTPRKLFSRGKKIKKRKEGTSSRKEKPERKPAKKTNNQPTKKPADTKRKRQPKKEPATKQTKEKPTMKPTDGIDADAL